MKEIKRNPGIDFLRLLAMYLVVVYHLLFHGGILDAGQNSGAAQLLRVLTLCAVDGFALISGYVGLREEKPRFPVNRMARLWLQTLFYSLLMLLAAACIYRPILSKSSLLRALLPVASDQYWYVTAYMPLCLMMPWLNALLCRLDRRELGQLAAGLTGLFCLYGTLANPLSENFRLWGGCHFSWLVILYVVGAALGRDGWLEKLKNHLGGGCFPWLLGLPVADKPVRRAVRIPAGAKQQPSGTGDGGVPDGSVYQNPFFRRTSEGAGPDGTGCLWRVSDA